jgi:transposase-like protein
MAETDNIVALAAGLGIQRKQLYCWRDAYQGGGPAGLRRAGRPSRQDKMEAALAVPTVVPAPVDPARRIAELERKIGEQQLALDFFRKALRHAREQRQQKGDPGETASTP